MKMSAAEEYGLRCLLQVAGHKGPEPIGIAEIAEAEGLSPEYAAKLLRLLRRGELVASTRGARGGYHLTKPAHEISIWSAILVLDGPLIEDTHCRMHTGRLPSCVHNTTCSLRGLLTYISLNLENVLRKLTLADLMQSEAAVTAQLQADQESTRQSNGERG